MKKLMKCPKCGYERQPSDNAPEWQCPSCKVAYAKVMQANNQLEVKSKAKPVAPKQQTQIDIQPDVEQDEEELNERYWLASRGQKIVIYSIILNFVLRAVDRAQFMPPLALDTLFFCLAVFSVAGVVKICSGLQKTQNQKIMFMVLSFFPLINLIALVYLSVKTNRLLRDAGWTIGLLGAKP